MFTGVGDSLEVWIECNGQRLVEYDVTTIEDGLGKSCFVPSIEGQSFKICYKKITPNQPLRMVMKFDGVKCDSRILTGNTGNITGVPVSNHSEKPYQFGRLTLTEDDRGVTSADILAQLGTIRLITDAVIVVSQQPYVAPPLAQLPGMTPVHERSKKAGSHAVLLGQAQMSNFSMASNVRSLGFPEYSAVFQYAPKDYLMARDIIPRQTAPMPAPSASTSSADIKPKVKRERGGPSTSRGRTSDNTITIISDSESDSEPQSVAAGKNRKGQPQKKKPKLEPLEVPRGTFYDGQVIDLTEDD